MQDLKYKLPVTGAQQFSLFAGVIMPGLHHCGGYQPHLRSNILRSNPVDVYLVLVIFVPVEKGTVPTIPEPEMVALLAVVGVLLIWLVYRKRRTVSGCPI